MILVYQATLDIHKSSWVDLLCDGLTLFPEICLVLGLLFIVLVILIKYNKYSKVPYALFIKNIALATAFINLSIGITVLIFFLRNNTVQPLYYFHDTLVFTRFTSFFKILTGALVVKSLSLLSKWWDTKSNKGVVWESPLLILGATFFMFLLISSNNLLLTFLLVEGLSVCLYFIIASELKGNAFIAVIIYFLLGGVSSVFFGYGVLRVY
jgi:NADH:ubiquinone oxidoreductase subunit 2 (subunit N)